MARTLTTANGKLGVWDDGDNPGAGTKGVRVDEGGVGLNPNWETIDKGLFTEHTTAGAHNSNVIKGSNLIQTGGNSVVDGTTLEFSSNQMRVKDASITAAKLASDAVTTVKVLDANITAAKLASDAVTTAKILDANVTTAKLAAASVTSAKLSADLGWQWIYGDLRVAATADTSAVAAVNEWTETTKTPVVKLSFFLPRITNGTTRILRVRCNAKSSLATRTWNVQLNDSAGTVLATANGINTSYDLATSEVNLSYTITDTVAALNIEYQVSVYVGAGVSGTANIKNLSVYCTPS